MATNCRFAFAVHVLSVLAHYEKEEDGVTSDRLARTVNTNAVVIRRLLCDMRAAGLVTTQRGPHGGTKLALPARKIDLAQVHRAVAGEFAPFGEHPNKPAQGCMIGRGILGVLGEISERAARAIEHEYASVSLADVLSRLEKESVPQEKAA
jgi:DNA-binding IscR family transcriptional regulator